MRLSCARVKVQVDLLSDLPKFVMLEVIDTSKNSFRVEKVTMIYNMLLKYRKKFTLLGHNEDNDKILYPELKKERLN